MASRFEGLGAREMKELDALLAGREGPWWDSFYQDRAKPCPFFTAAPCESLAEWVGSGLIAPDRAIDLGCGSGRNAIFLARAGFTAEGLDYSEAAIAWARDRVAESGVSVSLSCCDVFEAQLERGAYGL